MAVVGIRIKQARRRAGVTQQELANRVGLSVATISKYERSLSAPGSEVLLRFASALDRDVSFFLRPGRVETLEPMHGGLSALSEGAKGQVIERVRDWLGRYLEAEEIVGTPSAAFEKPEGVPRRIATRERT